MRQLRFVLPVVAGLFTGGVVQASPMLSAVFTTADDYHAALGPILGVPGFSTNTNAMRQAVTTIRIGNNQPGGGLEAGMYVPAPPSGTIPGTPGQTTWTSGAPIPFSLFRSGDNLTFQVGSGPTFIYDGTASGMANMTVLGLQLSTDPTSGSAWSSLSLVAGGPAIAIPDQAATSDGFIGQIISNLTGDFTLSGFTTLTFDPLNLPDAAQLSMRIAVFAPVPVPAALALFLAALASLVGVAAYRRA